MKIKDILKENFEKEFSSTVLTDIKLKSGLVINMGTKVKCFFDEHIAQTFNVEYGGEKPIRMPYTAASKYLKGFKKPPTTNALEKMSYDGVATTPLGSRTEPDGFGPYGEPSWMLVIGII